MKISVFGATGMVGSAVVQEALDRGHTVTAISRSPGDLPRRDGVRKQQLDVSTDDLDAALAWPAAAVLSIRFAPGQEHRLAPATARFLDAAGRAGTRIVVVGGSAPLRVPGAGTHLVVEEPHFVPGAWRSIALASLEQYRVCREHSGERCVYLSPPALLEPGERSGRYRRGTTTLLTDAAGVSWISAADLAVAVLDEIETPGPDPHFTVASAPTRSHPGPAER